MIRLKDVSLQLGNKKIFSGLNLAVGRGEFVYIVGSSGVGKSSLLKLLYMETFPDNGSVEIAEFNTTTIKKSKVPYLRRKIGIVFQDFRLLDDRTVYENIAFVLEVTGAKRKDIPARVINALTQVGLSQKQNEMPKHLSGGEQQRVAIARALVSEPYVLLADEPTGNLDPNVSLEIMKLLKKINQSGITVLVVTHDYNLVMKEPAKILQIKDGQVFEVSLKN